MKRMMLIGECGAGKSSLIRALSDEKFSSRRAMAVEYYGHFINTPGEFLENRRFYHALISASVECDIVAMLQDATRRGSLFPPQFAAVFSRKVVGVITKSDAAGADTPLAERFLRSAGAKELVCASTVSGLGLDALRAMLR